MSFLPGWDSVSATETIAHYLHVTAVVVLGLLFVAEGMALVYDFRNHRLIKAAESDREIAQKAKEDAAEARRKTEVEGLEKKLTEADRKFSDLQRQQADRHLTDEQKRQILEAIAPYPGQTVDLVTVMNDGEAIRYANEFLEIFKAAKWNVSGISQAAFTGDVRGILCAISAEWGQRGQAPIGAGIFMKTMISLGLIKGGLSDASVKGDMLKLVIGRKPPVP